jgi:trans-aconitate methyltransferase
MMSGRSEPYVLGGTQTEQQRLVAQAAEFENQSRWLLDQVDIQHGWRAVDIGCGPIGILNLLSERVGRAGSVISVWSGNRALSQWHGPKSLSVA